MGKSPKMPDGGNVKNARSDATKERFESVWRVIRSVHDEHYRIGLRTATTLIGFCLFPVGWSWLEYPSRDDFLPYEPLAEAVSGLEIELNERVRRTGTQARRNGVEFRKRDAMELLTRFVRRQEIPLILTDRHGTAISVTEEIRETFNDGLRIDVHRNQVGRSWQFATDAIRLAEALSGHKGWTSNSSPSDWLRIERYARLLFETRGLPETQEVYIKAILDWIALEGGTKEPALSTLREKVRALAIEYSFQHPN